MPEDRGTGWRKLEPKERVEALCELAASCGLPVTTYHDVVAYVLRGQPLGHFLTALITNDLRETCIRADDDSKYQIWNVVFFLYNHAPMECWGSPERYRKWVEIRGFEGLQQTLTTG